MMNVIKKMGIRQFLLIVCSALMITTPALAGHSGQGPSGGTGGTAFNDWGLANEKMDIIWVRSGAWIDSVRTRFDNPALPSGHRTTPHRGGFGGGLGSIHLAPTEYVTSISGYYGSFVNYLRIRTNTRTVSFGNAVGRYFTYQVPDSTFKFAGFLGASGSYLDSVGVNWRKK